MSEIKKIAHICLASFYVDNYSYQENILPKYHKILGYNVIVIASLVSFDKDGKSILLPNEPEYISENNIRVFRINYKRKFYKFNKLWRRY